MWSFRRSGGSGTEQPSSDAMAARGALQVSHRPLSFPGRLKPFFSFSAEKEKNGFKKLPPVCVERRQLPLGRGGLVSLNVYVVIDMVDAIAVVAIAL